MKLFANRTRAGDRGGVATAVPSGGAPHAVAADPAATRRESAFSGSTTELMAEIARLEAANRDVAPSPATVRQLLLLRHLAGTRLLGSAPTDPRHPEPDGERLPAFVGALPEFALEEVTPGMLRAAILRDGCLLVRRLVPRSRALALAEGIERSFVERDRHDDGEPAAEGFYEEFELEAPFDPYLGRPWIKMGGGVYAADSPRLSFEVAAAMRAVGLPGLVSDYLGEPALISVHKTTLRKADPSVPGTWHQDGKFMGPVRALNVWLSLSRCGDVAPGLDIVPRRLDDYAPTNTDEAVLETQVSQAKAEEAAGERGILRPIFEPGDALLFDEMFLHQTAAEPTMPNPRYAVEAWFFGGSGFPSAYAPLVI